MSVYIVTGKLGQGKTLVMADLINQGLAAGKRVATNLDINVKHIPLVRKTNTSIRLVRVPDKPTAEHIEALGLGTKEQTYDEATFGMLVLDECGTWLNSRDWSEEGRRELLNTLLHIRKKHWHVYLIIQDISMLDKQLRKALAEHVVYVRRLDNIRVPVISRILKSISNIDLRLPKLHIAAVRLGDTPHGLITDRWQTWGTDCYSMYDTHQYFRDDYPHGLHSILPPGYLRHTPKAKRNLRFYMRLTKIYLKKFSLVGLVGFAATTTFLLTSLFASSDTPSPDNPETAQTASEGFFTTPKKKAFSSVSGDVVITTSTAYQVDGNNIIEHTYAIDGVPITKRQLELSGLTIEPVAFCVAKITTENDSYFARCQRSSV